MRTQTRVAGPRDRRGPAVRRPWSRRVDQMVLRWQARLDAEWADRVAPWVGAGLLFALLFGLALARANSLEPGVVLAGFSQASWLISTGSGAEPTITGQHLLADHTPLIMWPIGFATAVLPTVPTLLAVQSGALALAVVPLWRLARKVVHLRVGAAATLAVSYGLHPAVQNLNLADFHPQTIAVAPLLAATYFGFVRRWSRFWVFALLSVACAAELGLAVAGLGLLLVLDGSRRHGMRALVLGVAWTVVAVLIVQPVFGRAGLVTPGAFADYGNTAHGVIGSMLTHPFRVLGDLTAEADLRLLLGVLAPLLFLPLLAPRYLLPAVPLQFLYLVAAVPLSGPAGAQYLVPIIPFAFVAATFALSRIGRRSVERVLVDRRVLIALVLAAVGFFALDAASSPYRQPWAWSDDGRRDLAIQHALEHVDDEEPVRASPAILPAIAERVEVYVLALTEPEAGRATRQVDVVIADDRDLPDWTTDESVAFLRAMTARGWSLVFREQGIAVWRSDSG